MKIFSWNVRGLGNPWAFIALRHEMQNHRPQIIFISESKINEVKAQIVKLNLGYDCCFCVESVGRSGGLLLLWHSNIALDITSFSKGHIDMIIDDSRGRWWFTGFYGSPHVEERLNSWNLLSRLKSLFNLPRIVGGDFNEILYEEEKSGGPNKDKRQLDNFINIISLCNLKTVSSVGDPFT